MPAKQLFLILALALLPAAAVSQTYDYSAESERHFEALRADPLIAAAYGAFYTLECTTGDSEAKIAAYKKHHDAETKIVADAGAGILPALTFLVSDRVCDGLEVSDIAKYATQFPLSEPFLAALRARRDDKAHFDQNAYYYLGAFEYFAAYGDRDDLAWMEATAKRFDGGYPAFVVEVAKLVEKFRARLSQAPRT